MPRGMPRKPAAIREMEGNRGHRPIPNEVKAFGKPKLPENFTEAEREVWNDLVRTIPKRILTEADQQVMERMSIAWASYRQLSALIRQSGPLAKGATGSPILNPLWRARALAAHEMHKCGEQLGLSPIARTRLTEPSKDEDDPLEQLLGMAANQ